MSLEPSVPTTLSVLKMGSEYKSRLVIFKGFPHRLRFRHMLAIEQKKYTNFEFHVVLIDKLEVKMQKLERRHR